MSSNFQSHDSGLNANGRFGRLSYLGWNMLTFLITIIAAVLFSIICAIVAPNFLSTATINGNLSISLLFIVGIFYIVLGRVDTFRLKNSEVVKLNRQTQFYYSLCLVPC